VGYYVDFMFDLDTFPGAERIAELFLEAGMEEQSPWSKKDDNGVVYHRRDFIDFKGGGLIALFDQPHGKVVEGKICAANSRLSWSTRSGGMALALTRLVELGEKFGFTPFEGKKFVNRENIGDIVADYEKSSAKIAAMWGTTKNNDSVKEKKG
jgi:hypothetical protein